MISSAIPRVEEFLMSIQLRISVALVASVLGMGTGAAQAERSTIVGNAGTITLDWQATRDRAGRPILAGHVITNGGKAGYCTTRLLVETLDAQGRVVAQNMGFVPGYVGGYDDVYFELPIRTPGTGYRASIASWDKCAGGQ